MTFREAVKQTPNFENAWQKGLEALRAQDKPHIVAENTRLLRGSVDVDKALQKQDPHAHRWDFAIGHKHTNRKQDCIYWVEIHTASDSQVNVVLDKLRWLRAWLIDDGKELDKFEREFIWVSSGATSFTLNSPQLKQFAVLGLQHKGKILIIPNARPT
jgi:hypothetical protein